jgi:hypothetical protein
VTLILTCVTDRLIVQASDRYLTWKDGTVADDASNKAIFYCGHMVFAYTGLSEINGENTAMWVVRQLATAPTIPEGILLLKEQLTEAWVDVEAEDITSASVPLSSTSCSRGFGDSSNPAPTRRSLTSRAVSLHHRKLQKRGLSGLGAAHI